MDETKATEEGTQKIAPEAVVISPEDMEARFNKLEEEKENYRKAYLKEAARVKSGEGGELGEDEKITAAVQKALAESHLAEINKEQKVIIDKTLKENKELKLAHFKKEPPAGMGSHSESTPVRDTLVTPEQMAYFKSKNWTDKDIEHYKKNLGKRI